MIGQRVEAIMHSMMMEDVHCELAVYGNRHHRTYFQELTNGVYVKRMHLADVFGRVEDFGSVPCQPSPR